MRQVPEAKPWLLIGSGRLATHLAVYFGQLGIRCRQWSRAHGWHGPAPPGAAGLDEALARFDRVLLAIRDDALASFVDRHRRAGPSIWVHFSGSRSIEGAWAAHPLCTFGPEPYGPEVYPTIPFVVDREGPPLEELLPGLPNPSATVPVADRPLYHALCVAAGNFTTLLWRRFFAVLEARWGLDSAVGVPYLRRTLANLEAAGSRTALTGPIARRDHETIAANLAALDGAGLTDLAGVYRAFGAAHETTREGSVKETAA